MADKLNLDAFDEPITDSDIQAVDQIDLSAFDQPSEPSPIQAEAEIGAGQAALEGAASGATFGLSDLVSAGTSVAGTALTGELFQQFEAAKALKEAGIKDPDQSPSNILEAFNQARLAAAAKREAASEQQPGAFLGGSLAGSLLGVGAAGSITKGLAGTGRAGQVASKVLPSVEGLTGGTKGARILAATREGAKAGGLAGFGQSKESILDDPLAVAKQTAATAAGGALLGGTLQGGLEGVKSVAGAIGSTRGFEQLKTAFEEGKKGISTRTEQALVTQRTKLKDIAENIRKNLTIKTSRIGQELGAIKDTETRAFSLADIIAKMESQLDEIPDATLPIVKDKAALIKTVLEDIPEGIDLNGLSAKEADLISKNIKRVVTDFGDKSLLKSDEIKAIGRAFSEDVKNLIKKEISDPRFGVLNKKFSAFKDNLRRLNFATKKGQTAFTKVDIENQINKLARNIESTGDPVKASAAADGLNEFFSSIEKLDKPLFDKLKPQIDDIVGTIDVIKGTIKTPEFSEGVTRGIIGSGKSLLLRGANIAGQATKTIPTGIKNTATDFARGTAKLSRLSDDQIAGLATKLEQRGSQFANVIKEIQGSPSNKRNALLFGLAQQPAFRETLRDMGEGIFESLDPDDE